MKSSDDVVHTFEADSITFFSRLDEDCYFSWLRRIPSTLNVYGRGTTIFIEVAGNKVTDEDLRELIAVFHRYGGEMSQFVVFNDSRFAGWFADEGAYWHGKVFRPIAST